MRKSSLTAIIYNFARLTKQWLLRLVTDTFSRTRLLSAIYYGVFSPALSREAHAVLWGKRRYNEECSGAFYCLVRNVHRLEKGLCMPNRRPVFAADYIWETVDAYRAVTNQAQGLGLLSSEQLEWANDVLAEYFAVVEATPKILAAEAEFHMIRGRLNVSSDKKRLPYMRQKSAFSNIRHSDFIRLCMQRRSVRLFKSQPVPRDLLDKAMLAASLAPSACNRQPFEYQIYDDPELLKQVVDIPMGTAGWGEGIPVIVAVVGQLRAYFNERDRHIIYIDGALSAMSFMYALETLGLSSCPINFPDIAERENRASKVLGLEKDERVVMMIAVGYAADDGLIAFSQKKNIDSLRSYNKTACCNKRVREP